MKIVLADVSATNLEKVGNAIAKTVGEPNVLVLQTDVSKMEEVERLRERVYEAYGEVNTTHFVVGIDRAIILAAVGAPA
jgi:NADP-dependent 3-hydroxy acid dehydrogenase YdfG